MFFSDVKTNWLVLFFLNMTGCKSLYFICLEYCVLRLENYSRNLTENESYQSKWIENLGKWNFITKNFFIKYIIHIIIIIILFFYLKIIGGSIAEDLLNYAYQKSNLDKNKKKIWKDEWKIFFTSKMKFVTLVWDDDLIGYVGRICKVKNEMMIMYKYPFGYSKKNSSFSESRTV